MSKLCADIGYRQAIKYGETLCGDRVEVLEPEEDSSLLVLADGLGSGVKANILSTLTSKIIATMMANKMSLEDCVSAIAETLPICSQRKIAYSTFTILHILKNNEAEIIQYDNPMVILLRDGQNMDYDKIALEIQGKTIYRSRIKLQLGDVFVLTSDGAEYAGPSKNLNYNWQREDIIRFIQNFYVDSYTAKTFSSLLLDECMTLYEQQPRDDTTIVTVKIRERKSVNLAIGPPIEKADDEKMMSLFFSKEGSHIICGGTTAEIAARYLKQEVRIPSQAKSSDVPPISAITGVDLVTEGTLTMNKVLTYAQDYIQENKYYTNWCLEKDGAAQIARLLFEEATDINFFVGRAVNPAHQNPNLPIHFNVKMRLVEELADALKKMGKKIKVSYF